jgi:hypothetical protein
LVAVAAIDSESADVMLVTERNDLLALDALVREIRRANDTADDPQHETSDEHRAEDRDARERICTTVKDLRHVLPRGNRWWMSREQATRRSARADADHIQNRQ